jgi:hypothetical protein
LKRVIPQMLDQHYYKKYVLYILREHASKSSHLMCVTRPLLLVRPTFLRCWTVMIARRRSCTCSWSGRWQQHSCMSTNGQNGIAQTMVIVSSSGSSGWDFFYGRGWAAKRDRNKPVAIRAIDERDGGWLRFMKEARARWWFQRHHHLLPLTIPLTWKLTFCYVYLSR